jgi:hypothetical protein
MSEGSQSRPDDGPPRLLREEHEQTGVALPFPSPLTAPGVGPEGLKAPGKGWLGVLKIRRGDQLVTPTGRRFVGLLGRLRDSPYRNPLRLRSHPFLRSGPEREAHERFEWGARSGTRLPPDLFQPQVPDAPQGIPFPAGLADPVWPLPSGE